MNYYPQSVYLKVCVCFPKHRRVIQQCNPPPRVARRYIIQDRINWVTEYAVWRPCDWDSVVFSDENKCNLDGSNWFACYWYRIHTEESIFSKPQGDEKSLMSWAAFSRKDKTNFAIWDERQKARKYRETLQSYLTAFVARGHSSNSVFQQENASTHTCVTRRHSTQVVTSKLQNVRQKAQIWILLRFCGGISTSILWNCDVIFSLTRAKGTSRLWLVTKWRILTYYAKR